MRSNTRRRFLRGLGFGCAGLAVSACQPHAPAAPEPSATPAPTETSTPSPAPTTPPAAATTSPGPLPTGTAASQAKASVGIARAASYDPKTVRQALESTLDGIGGLGDVIRPGARVAIKVNLTGGTQWVKKDGLPATEVYVTHPQVVRSLCELLRDAGASKIYIVEGVYEPESWTTWGYDEVAKAAGAELVDLNGKAPFKDFVRVPSGSAHQVYENISLNPILQEIDAFVSVPKMKCHYTAGVTLSLKNLIGIGPLGMYRKLPKDTSRSAFHGAIIDGVDPRLVRVILDMNHTRPVNLAVIDGILSSEGGEGPWIKTMQPVQPGVLLAGKDPLATDVVATAVMGFDPAAADRSGPFVRSENYLRMAGKLGLGTYNMEEISIAGAAVEDVRTVFKTAK